MKSKKQIYREIAKKHGVSWQEVRADMQSALEIAYTNPDKTIMNVVRQGEVPRKNLVPTPAEFLDYAKNTIKNTTDE